MRRLTIGGLFFLLLVYCHQARFDGPTPASRLCLLHSICVHHSLEIGNCPKSTPDKAEKNGKFYSDKAPGMAAAALPGFAAGWFSGRLFGLNEQSRLLLGSWLACASTSAVVVAIGAALLWQAFSGFAGARWSLLAVTAFVFGSAPFPYSTLLFSQALVAGLLSVVLWAVLPPANKGPGVEGLSRRRSPLSVFIRVICGQNRGVEGASIRRFYAAGFCAGWALASEYSCGLVVVGLLIYFHFEHGWPKTRAFLLGGAPPLLMIPLYSWLTIGSPFELPYSFQANFPAMREGLYAIKRPDLETASQLLFSPERGLLFWSPFYILALFGWPELFRRAPRLFLLTYAVPILQVIVISGRVWDWPAGPTYGPRLLTPMLPLLALPCVLGLKRFPLLGIPLAIYSVAATTLAALTDAFPDFYSHPNPLLDLQLPLLLKGRFSPTVATELGMSGYSSAALFCALLAGGVSWLLLKAPKSAADNPVCPSNDGQKMENNETPPGE